MDTSHSIRRRRRRQPSRWSHVGRHFLVDIIAMLLILHHISYTSGFLPVTAGITKKPLRSLHGPIVISLSVGTDLSISLSTTDMASSIDNIRQYVPLGVSVLVIIDILLGSPMANGLLNKIRPTETDTTNEGIDKSMTHRKQTAPPSKERIDSQKVAQEAIQRAKYTLELRTFLDAQRDPVVELQRKMDQQTALLEQNQQKLQDELQQQQQPPRSKNDSL